MTSHSRERTAAAVENYLDGPWVPNIGTLFVRDRDGNAVASVYGNTDLLSDPCGRARTRAIAALPDLVKALDSAKAAMGRWISDGIGDDITVAFEEASAALAAAKGAA